MAMGPRRMITCDICQYNSYPRCPMGSAGSYTMQSRSQDSYKTCLRNSIPINLEGDEISFLLQLIEARGDCNKIKPSYYKCPICPLKSYLKRVNFPAAVCSFAHGFGEVDKNRILMQSICFLEEIMDETTLKTHILSSLL